MKRIDDRVRFYVSDRLKEVLRKRRDFVRQDTILLNMIGDRYDEMCRRDMPQDLSEAELNLIRDMLNSVALWDNAGGIAHIGHDVEDCIRLDRLGKKWDVDGKELVDKLAGYTYGQLCAIVDSVEIWWKKEGEK